MSRNDRLLSYLVLHDDHLIAILRSIPMTEKLTVLEEIMLELRPNCEHCNKMLSPDATDAMICSFECTFCLDCVKNVLHEVCPNCGGNFCQRPMRPSKNWGNNNDLSHYPARIDPIYKPVDLATHAKLRRAQEHFYVDLAVKNQAPA